MHASHIFTARLLSGALGGAISQTLVAPLEFARLQIMMGGKQSVLSILKSTIRREGFGALWRGNNLTLMRMVPSKAIDMAVSSAILSTTGSAATAGGAAAFSATLVTYPLETLRSRMACSKAETGLALVQATIRKEGYGALYRGLGPSLVAIVPYAAVSLLAFDALNKVHASFGKETTRRSSSHRTTEICQASPWITFAFGAIAGSMATTATFPIELCRKQVQGGVAKGGVLNVAWNIMQTQGPKGLYKGLGASCLKLAPASGLYRASCDVAFLALLELARSQASVKCV